MKPLKCFQWGEWISRLVSFAAFFTAFTTGILLIEAVTRASGVVTSPTEASLRAAMTGGGTVTFACDGTITLGGTITNSLNTVLDASGHQIAVSGSNAVRVFFVSSNVKFTVINLTIASGRSAQGGGIYNDGGTLNLSGAVLQANNAVSPYPYPYFEPATEGGGIFLQGGIVNATNCSFFGNAASQPNGYSCTRCRGHAHGGAICNQSGQVHLQNCSFVGNNVSGSTPGSDNYTDGGDGLGGAVYNNGSLIVNACTFDVNGATGGAGSSATSSGAGGYGGNALGGAICNLGTLVVSGSVFSGNMGTGGVAGNSGSYDGYAGGQAGGAAIYSFGQLSVQGSTFARNRAVGGRGGSTAGQPQPPSSPGGAGGAGNGGAVFILGTATLSGSTLVQNVAIGAIGGTGGTGNTYVDVGTPGGVGGAGGSANGAGLFSGGTLKMVNCTIVSNTASGGSGGTGGRGGYGPRNGGMGGTGGTGGSGCGGICDTNGSVAMTNCTLALNLGQSGAGGFGGLGGSSYPPPTGNPGSIGPNGTNGVATGGLRTVGAKLLNTLLAFNIPTNFSGTITDAGHNLSSDGSCTFSGSGSMNDTDPKLGPLADNGGPTFTMALLFGSPAINGGTAIGAPDADQRGVLRPQGPGVDMGAFEYQYVPVFTGAKLQTNAEFWLQISGLLPAQAFKLQVSTNLLNWSDLTNISAGATGMYEFVDGNPGNGSSRFYRLKCATP